MRKGLSLIEVLIAMAMSGMIFVVVGTLLTTLLVSNTKSRRQEVFEQVKNDLFVEFTNSVRWGKEIGYDGEVLRIDGNEYKLESGVINKNGKALSAKGVEITNFSVISRSGSEDLKSYEIRVEMRDRGFDLNTDVLNLVVSQRKTEVNP